MSRRKQARPVRLLEDGSHVPAGEGTGSEDEGGSSCGEGGVFCPACQTEVGTMSDLEEHLKDCRGGKAAAGGLEEEARRQDAENNNSSVEESVGERAELGLVAGHVTLEALQNTKVAVAQFAATAMANNADNAAALQELAVLQSTLYTLQQQQMLQLNLIHQLQQQLQITRTKDGPAPPSPKPSPEPVVPASQSVPATPPPRPLTPPKTLAPEPSASLPPCSVSSSFASSIITNLDPPPSPSEPNTLEMLQRRAQEVLDNASQGLLANNLADELAFRKSKGSLSPYDSKSGRNEPFFKHRCRYCGKVFGSDSALQIHIRSHTGERPFKCNVCGSRFTTKGNLKVHFQRHTVKFPHIKMNPNPVPEHLDKYHPPLLAQMGAHQSLPPGVSPPQFPTGSQFGLPMYRPPHPPSHDQIGSNSRADPKSLMPLGVFGPRIIDTQDVPENLSKSVSQPSPQSTGDGSERCKREIDDIGKDSMEGDSLPVDGSSRLSPKHEMEGDYDSEQPNDRYPSPTSYDDCSFDSKYTSEDVIGDRESPGMEKNDDSLQEQPENLSNKMNGSGCDDSEGGCSPGRSSGGGSPPGVLDLSGAAAGQPQVPPGGVPQQQVPSLFPPFPPGLLPPPPPQAPPSPLISSALSSLTSSVLTSTTFNPLALTVNHPGERRFTGRGNTTCQLCYKTFACNSALEIHYRSHTKERPFKCSICERGFSTKGNMKQHMLTHKIRDMPAHLFDQQQRSEGVGSAAGQQLVVPPPPSAPSAPTTPTPPMPTKEDVEIPSRPPSEPPQRPLDIRSSQDSSDEAPPAKRPTPPDHSEPLPAPKRPHSLPKHLCNVCNKNFSSSSALQIHMRTHTGDKPFRCTICHKAFTTKGNLKVHMGTHMWTNGASRRGRRMSLELPPLAPPPPPHPPQLKDSPDSYLHPRPRPDLFYPYLPAPFLNGIHQKVSELASTGQLSGGNGMVGLGGFGMDLKVERRSPEPKVPLPTSLWYFERRQPGADPASPRSEGLTA